MPRAGAARARRSSVVVLGVAVVVWLVTACGPFRSYGTTMQVYLDSFAARDYVAVEANMCREARERIRASDVSWDEIYTPETQRVGDLADATFERARGSQERAVFAIETGDQLSWYDLPIADEDGELLPCPVGVEILGSHHEGSPRLFGPN